jgi:chromosome segregation ATPase
MTLAEALKEIGTLQRTMAALLHLKEIGDAIQAEHQQRGTLQTEVKRLAELYSKAKVDLAVVEQEIVQARERAQVEVARQRAVGDELRMAQAAAADEAARKATMKREEIEAAAAAAEARVREAGDQLRALKAEIARATTTLEAIRSQLRQAQHTAAQALG